MRRPWPPRVVEEDGSDGHSTQEMMREEGMLLDEDSNNSSTFTDAISPPLETICPNTAGEKRMASTRSGVYFVLSWGECKRHSLKDSQSMLTGRVLQPSPSVTSMFHGLDGALFPPSCFMTSWHSYSVQLWVIHAADKGSRSAGSVATIDLNSRSTTV